ncbi:lytic transglycosylase domain-containing protein [Arenibaculum sp.]|uniref:lytic transglycosylase domain-containing protein n=1 Tax=Arenibaculum sp. TaxID=2865862 RepID=UPI002E12711E|nr:lytic transglycosylase domain-containing protein [Arenibaculum sp.]
MRSIATTAFLLAVTLSFLPAAPARASATLSAQDVAAYRAAFAAAEAGRWADARLLGSRAAEPLPAKVLAWMEMAHPDGGTDFRVITAFLSDNPHWPNLAALRRNAEAAMPATLDRREVAAWFERFPALTGTGVIRHADALVATGAPAQAATLVRDRWIDGNFTPDEERELLRRFGGFLTAADHAARLDRLVWDGNAGAARRMYPVVDAGWKALAEARLALTGARPGVDGLIRAVPDRLREHPGLLYERLRWRRRKDLEDGALEIIRAKPAELGRPAAWWSEQHILARRAIERGDYALAYRLAAEHGQRDGLPFAQAEFLAGWLALRFLDRPEDALRHFHSLYENVGSPISLSRGAYWAGRAAEALRRPDEATRWYGLAAQHVTTFYGMLAAERLSHGGPLRLPAEPAPSAEAEAAFAGRELVRIARMLNQISPETDREGPFLRRLGLDAANAEEHALISRLALDLSRPDLAVWTGKQGAQNAIVVADGYPVIDMPRPGVPDPALVHALIRQESTFDRRAVSPVGARGLMQLMPGTAREVAGKLGLTHSNVRLTDDPEYNITLGNWYVQNLLDRFNGSYVLATAAYNAGPSRVQGWLRQFGDPRAEGVDVIDWIEMIPIYETRNYVQRVMEGMYVYRARLNGGTYRLTLGDDLRR